ncbi:MAG: type II secretion system protein GspJ [Opitutaceae bacterium]|nr:type II secretion system protein GspJ [Opitutaceae bacterium]
MIRRASNFAGTRGSTAHRPVAVGSGTGGFTLLELLLATAVAAVVLIVIQTTFFGALRLSNTTHAKIEADLELARALGIVRRDFSGLMLPGGPLAGQLQSMVFASTVGDSFGDRLSPDLYTNSGKIDGWNQFSEVQRVTYFLGPATDGGNTKDLVRVVNRNLLPIQDTPGEPEVLLHGVSEATIEFYDGTAWTSEWDSEASSTVPNGIRLRLTLARTDLAQSAPEPIELVVPVFIATTTTIRAAAESAPVELLP